MTATTDPGTGIVTVLVGGGVAEIVHGEALCVMCRETAGDCTSTGGQYPCDGAGWQSEVNR